MYTLRYAWENCQMLANGPSEEFRRNMTRVLSSRLERLDPGGGSRSARAGGGHDDDHARGDEEEEEEEGEEEASEAGIIEGRVQSTSPPPRVSRSRMYGVHRSRLGTSTPLYMPSSRSCTR